MKSLLKVGDLVECLLADVEIEIGLVIEVYYNSIACENMYRIHWLTNLNHSVTYDSYYFSDLNKL